MGIDLIVFIGLALIAVASYFISTAIYRRMVKAGNRKAIAIRVVAFLGSFLVITVIVVYLILANVAFVR